MSEPSTTDEKPPADGEKPPAAETPAAEDPRTEEKPAVTEMLAAKEPSTETAPTADAPAGKSDAIEASGADAAPKKKKKKKKRADDAPKREELDAEGRERPTFVLTFPSDPVLDHAVKAFELGDYQSVRAEASKLAEHPSQRVRDAASELLRRIEPDPLVKVLLAMAVLLLLVVTVWAYRTHGVH
jgi:hypothetical protein